MPNFYITLPKNITKMLCFNFLAAVLQKITFVVVYVISQIFFILYLLNGQ